MIKRLTVSFSLVVIGTAAGYHGRVTLSSKRSSGVAFFLAHDKSSLDKPLAKREVRSLVVYLLFATDEGFQTAVHGAETGTLEVVAQTAEIMATKADITLEEATAIS